MCIKRRIQQGGYTGKAVEKSRRGRKTTQKVREKVYTAQKTLATFKKTEAKFEYVTTSR